jgi:hypothetical protein
VAGDFADLFRGGAENVQHVTVAVDAVTATLERAGQPDRVLCADRGRGPVVAAEHLLQGPLGAQLAFGDHDDVVDRLGDLGQYVAGDQHRAPVCRLLPHQTAQPGDPGRVEPVVRLVEDQDLRVAEQRGGDRQALTHAHRVALHTPVGGVAEPDRGQDLLDAVMRMVSRDGQDPQVVAGAATRMERGVLEHRAHTGAGLVELVVAQTPERGRSRRWPHQSEQRANGGALPGPVRSEEPRDATGLDVEREVIDGGDIAEVLGEIVDLDGGHRSALRSGGDGRHDRRGETPV